MVRFADRMDLLKGSAIRELLALANKPDIISFAGGMPAPELFPVEKVKAAADAVLEESGRIALQYTSTDGWPRLREQIAERMERKNNIHTDAAHILMTSGSQQGLDYSSRVFVNPGDVIIIESPSYLGARQRLQGLPAQVHGNPHRRRRHDHGGSGEDPRHHRERVKMIYVIPDFQNPTGRTWDLERRHQFMEIVNRTRSPSSRITPTASCGSRASICPP
jgi:2-aminoadipate transaminase